jgi:hypothetical protein
VSVLCKGLTWIRDEILTLREERARFLSGLQLETKDRKRVVSGMLARFSKDLAEIARRRRNVRMVFLLDLKQTVFRLRQATRETLGGVREAFSSFGSTAPGSAARVPCPLPGAPALEIGRGGTSRAGQASTKIERGRRRKSVRHQHRP